MKKFKSHKIVEAARIVRIEDNPQPNAHNPMGNREIELDTGTVLMGAMHTQLNNAEVGGYYVRYADGYCSYSPAKAFEEGYTEVVDEPRTESGEVRYGMQGSTGSGAVNHAGRATDANQQTNKAQPCAPFEYQISIMESFRTNDELVTLLPELLRHACGKTVNWIFLPSRQESSDCLTQPGHIGYKYKTTVPFYEIDYVTPVRPLKDHQTIKAQPDALVGGLRASLDRQSDEQAMAALEQFGKEGTSTATADAPIDPHGTRGYVNFDSRPTSVNMNEDWMGKVEKKSASAADDSLLVKSLLHTIEALCTINIDNGKIADSLISASFKTPAQSGATFGVALAAIKNGQKVTRAGWSGKGLAVKLIIPGQGEHFTQPTMGLLVPETRTFTLGAIQPWAPSGSDALAEDWIILAD